jgi:heme-degrading monooxygenase HmoA
MEYVIDVIASQDQPGFVDFWHDQAGQLREQLGFVSGELFALQRNIRDAHYTFVAVYAWRGIDDYQAVLAAGLMPTAVRKQDIKRTNCHLAIQLSELADMAEGHIWLINPFEITEAQIPDVLDMWDKAKDHMVAKQGFINARLFKTNQPSARYGLVNVSQWQSADLFMQALDDKAYDRHRERSMNYTLHPSLCARIGLVHAGASELIKSK